MAGLTHLLIVDPQVDFCDPRGSLYVNGAEADMERLAGFVRRAARQLDAVHVTLDTHHLFDVAHPLFWQDSAGAHPAPFTIVSAEDVAHRVWTPSRPEAYERMLQYVRELEKRGNYPLCIWPPHCLIGSPGHAVAPALRAALEAWETDRLGLVKYVFKGLNPWTEHYSAVSAEVPDPHDPATQVNRPFLDTLMEAERVLVAGEAGSHCVANTVRDVVTFASDRSFAQRLVLLTDATSPVTGFEPLQERFLHEMQQVGMRTARTEEVLA